METPDGVGGINTNLVNLSGLMTSQITTQSQGILLLGDIHQQMFTCNHCASVQML